MKEFIRIDTDGSYTTFDGSTLKALQDAVGGLITAAPVMPGGYIPRNTTVYANDEGLMLGMDSNHTATRICNYPLVGPVVIRKTKAVVRCLELDND